MDAQATKALRERLSGLKDFGAAPHEAHGALPSTQKRLAELAAEGAPHGTVVIAATQSKGRGRRGNKYACPEGGLWFSLLLRGEQDPTDAPTTLLAGLAASQALDEVGRVATELKWPNDVLLNDKKLGGILAEMGRDEIGPRLILGVGLNVNLTVRDLPFLLRASASSLLIETGREHSVADVLYAFLSWLEGHLRARAEKKGPYLIGQVGDRMPMIGREVRMRVGAEKVRGRALGLAADGALMVSTDQGRRKVIGGEVEEVRRVE